MTTCGMDEVGRGALAGPLVACAIILDDQIDKKCLNDSKKLNPKQRDVLFEIITNSNSVIKIEFIEADLINQKGIGWANKEIFLRLLKSLEADEYIIDGRGFDFNLKTKSIIKADQKFECVMAASIVAKVTRDRYMKDLHHKYDVYGWDKNKGYGTKVHIEALKKFGPVAEHRELFVSTALS